MSGIMQEKTGEGGQKKDSGSTISPNGQDGLVDRGHGTPRSRQRWVSTFHS